MSDDLLEQIQSLQYSDKQQAEHLLVKLIREMFPLDVATVELRPLAVSLNSFNGFMTLRNGQRYFFKTHTEPDSVIGEYYNTTTLADAGYDVIRPVYSSTEWGKQLLIYEVIDDPSVFDLAWAIEFGESNDLQILTQVQQQEDEELLRLYRATLDWQPANDAAQAKVHQLFYHRLTGGRLERFYGPLPGQPTDCDVPINLPGGDYAMSEVRRVRWQINGQYYDMTLDMLIEQAIRLLDPARSGPSVIGHGDAHNGNIFFRRDPDSLLYFDPAFAGRHDPLLDLTKPLFHNVFAMWMYFPQEVVKRLHISIDRDGDVWQVEHDYFLHEVRKMFWNSKGDRVLIPTLREVKAHGWLREDWRAYLKAALFCCPFLTMNLADSAKFPPEISLLGLTMAVEMGAESREKRSFLDQTLDRIAHQL